MKIQTIRYANPEHSTLIVNDTMSVPWPCRTWHNELIQEWLDAGNTITPYQRFATVAEARDAFTRAAYAHARQLLDAQTADYSSSEMIRWPQLEAEARSVKTGAKAGPYMTAEVAGGRRTEAELADVVVAKADALEAYRVAVINARTAVVKDIQAAGLEVLESYDVASDARWP